MNPDMLEVIKTFGTWLLIGGGAVGVIALTGIRRWENQLWRELNIKNANGEYPHLLDKMQTADGITYVIYIPDGVDMKKMLKDGKWYHMIKQSFADMNDCEVKPIDGHKLSIKVIAEQLAKKYEYPVNLITETKHVLKIPIGVSLKGIVYLEIGDSMPHTIVAGTSGFGKSTVMKTMLTYIVAHQEKVDLYLIDMKKGVEFSTFANCNKVCQCGWEKADATRIIKFLVQEMENRYRTFMQEGVKNIDKFNAKYPDKRMNRALLVVDEFADLSKEKNAMNDLIDIGRKGRAAGVHMILATQYPTSRVVDTQLKTNIIGRVCFKVENYHDSMTILDHVGAEQIDIVGRGIAKRPSVGDIEFQGYYLDDATIEKIIRPTISVKPKTIMLKPIDNTSGDEFI